MRKFDYLHLPKQLFGGKVGDAHVHLYEDKGKLETLLQLHPEAIHALQARARIDNIDASARIEGLYTDFARVKELLAGAQATNETEAQLLGYARALELCEAKMDSLTLSTASILQMYETLFAHHDLGRKSRYRKKDYMYVQVDGHPQAMPVSPITAFETPLVLGGACDSLANAFDADSCSPLVLAAVFTIDFLCIRPFDEGNGRIARLFAKLMLEKAGFLIARYVSIDRLIEASGMAYYDALNACVDGWDVNTNDYVPYVLFWFDLIHRAHQQFFDELNIELKAGNSKSERVRLFVLNAKEAVGKREILSALQNVSEATVEAALGQMVKEGLVEKVGAARTTKYRLKSSGVADN